MLSTVAQITPVELNGDGSRKRQLPTCLKLFEPLEDRSGEEITNLCLVGQSLVADIAPARLSSVVLGT